MATVQHIDIIIPSYRLDESFLYRLITMDRPVGWQVNFFIIADNPGRQIPSAIIEWKKKGCIQLIVHEENAGPAGARNAGIIASSAKWMLFLDDDVLPLPGLLDAYTSAIQLHPDAIGFAGITQFPPPESASSKALIINGSIAHFDLAKYKRDVVWTPTANVLLNRSKMDSALFDRSLRKSGEDIDFLTRNSFMFHEKYISVPAAIVRHPWWDHGKVQTARLFRYGGGGSEIAALPHLKEYTYRDFPNIIETWFTLIVLFPFAALFDFLRILLAIALASLIAELTVNFLKVMIKGKMVLPAVVYQLTWIRIVYQLGYLFAALTQFRFGDLMRRVDLDFAEQKTSSFPLDRWKMIKIVLISSLIIAYLITGPANK